MGSKGPLFVFLMGIVGFVILAGMADWLLENNFTFLGYRCYDLVEKRGRARWRPVSDSALGILRDAQYRTDSDS